MYYFLNDCIRSIDSNCQIASIITDDQGAFQKIKFPE